MKRKIKQATRRTEEARVALYELHHAYVSDKAPTDINGRVKLRELARQCGVPFAVADENAHVEYWDLERAWRHARAWHAQYGLGAHSEEEFIDRFTRRSHMASIAKSGPEGGRYAEADARDVWRRIMYPALIWEARQEHKSAEDAFRAVEEARRVAAPAGRWDIFGLSATAEDARAAARAEARA